MVELGGRIQSVRKAQKMSLKQLAQTVGISEQSLIKIEKGTVDNPGFNTVAAIADALHVSLDYLHKGSVGLTREDVEVLQKHEPTLRALHETLAMLLSKL